MDESRTFSGTQRKKLAGKGQALPGGGFPIANEQDLRNAIQAYGRAKNKPAAKAHIIKRAQALGLTRLLPDSWKTSKATCPEDDCGRAFLYVDDLATHAETVHPIEESA